jgi:hypothetical protein
VCVFVRADLPYIALDVFQFCVEKVIQLCVLQINIREIHFIAQSLYRSSVGNSNQFLNLLGATLRHICISLYLNSYYVGTLKVITRVTKP